MGVKHSREYVDILDELARAISQVKEFYRFFQMETADWEQLSEDEQQGMTRTLADDLFYGLDHKPMLDVGCGSIKHDMENHVLIVSDGDQLIQIVNLV